jgi:ribokinase
MSLTALVLLLQAYIMLAEDGENSIIIALGANESAWNINSSGAAVLSSAESATIAGARVLLLQREVPDAVNLAAARVARAAGVTVMLDMGGKAGDVDTTVFPYLSLFSLNETELARVSGKDIDLNPISDEERESLSSLRHCPAFSVAPVVSACQGLLESGVERVMVTLGRHGALLVGSKGVEAYHPGYELQTVVDTTGAGDCFRANYAVAFASDKTPEECLQFAAAAATVCISRKGTLPSMPDFSEVMEVISSGPRR